MAIAAAGGLLFIADTEAEIPTSGMVAGSMYYAKDTKRFKVADSATTCYGGPSGITPSGGSALIVGAIADGEYLKRVGSTIVGAVPAGGSDAFPVGSVFLAVVSTDPATLLGYGTWSAFGAGRMLVGRDAGDADFDTAEETGGAKTHMLTTAEMPAHTHVQDAHTHTQNSHNHTQDAHNHTQDAHVHTQRRNNVTTGANSGWTTAFDTSSSSPVADSGTGTGSTVATNQAATATNQAATATNQNATATNQNTGGGGAHNNMPPYIVVYMWKRTA